MATLAEIRHAMQEEYNSSSTAAERYAIDDEFIRHIRRELDKVDRKFNLEQSMHDTMRTKRDYISFAQQCDMELQRRTPTACWPDIQLLEWYEKASIEEVWWAVDPHLYSVRCKEAAVILGCVIDTIYSYRKKHFRSKSKPSFENFVKLLSI